MLYGIHAEVSGSRWRGNGVPWRECRVPSLKF